MDVEFKEIAENVIGCGLIACIFSIPGSAILAVSLKWIERKKPDYRACLLYTFSSSFLSNIFGLVGIYIAAAYQDVGITFLVSQVCSLSLSVLLLPRIILKGHPWHPVFYTAFALFSSVIIAFVLFLLMLLAMSSAKG
jgi:hypothetical protein